MSNSDHVAMYCMAVFWRRLVYSSMVKNPDLSLSVAAEVYFQFPFGVLRRSRPVSRPVSRLVAWA